MGGVGVKEKASTRETRNPSTATLHGRGGEGGGHAKKLAARRFWKSCLGGQKKGSQTTRPRGRQIKSWHSAHRMKRRGEKKRTEKKRETRRVPGKEERTTAQGQTFTED